MPLRVLDVIGEAILAGISKRLAMTIDLAEKSSPGVAPRRRWWTNGARHARQHPLESIVVGLRALWIAPELDPGSQASLITHRQIVN